MAVCVQPISVQNVNKFEIEKMRALYNLGAFESLAVYADDLLHRWGVEYLPPEHRQGETQKKYVEREKKFARSHYEAIVRRIQGMMAQATMGGSAMLASDGITLKDGAKIILEGREIANVGGKKEDWTLPVGAYPLKN